MMDLDKIAPAIKKAMANNREYLFIITPDKSQHLPVRTWDASQLTEKYHQLLGEELLFDEWHGMLTVTNPQQEMILVLPKGQL